MKNICMIVYLGYTAWLLKFQKLSIAWDPKDLEHVWALACGIQFYHFTLWIFWNGQKWLFFLSFLFSQCLVEVEAKGRSTLLLNSFITINNNRGKIRWCLFFLFFDESNLFLKFRLFFILFFMTYYKFFTK